MLRKVAALVSDKDFVVKSFFFRERRERTGENMNTYFENFYFKYFIIVSVDSSFFTEEINSFLPDFLNGFPIKLELGGRLINNIPDLGATLESQYLIHINVENFLLVILTTLLLDLVEVVTGIFYLTIQQLRHPLSDVRVLCGGSLEDGARPPVSPGEK